MSATRVFARHQAGTSWTFVFIDYEADKA